jgi:fructose-1,6-bisphosphatase/inositol monophosphatase family enzyme
MANPRDLLEPLLELHDTIRLAVLDATDRDSRHALAGVSRQDAADTIYAIDVVAEQVLTGFAAWLAETQTFVLIAEGLHGGKQVWPKGTAEADATWRIIVDPIDGTRGLMYQKRSGWILSAAAPNRGPATSLQDVVLAVQTEIPLRKQHLSDHVRAIKGEGVTAHRDDRITGDRTELALRASRAGTIAHGYATVVRFFPGHREQLAAIDDEVVRAALGPGEPGKALCFEDQYASTGGQVYELLAGHDRFIADLRPLVGRATSPPNSGPPGLCCHPYDICTALIATESGVIITDPTGGPLNAPLDTTTNVAWVGYANERIRQQIEPLLQASLRTRGWI